MHHLIALATLIAAVINVGNMFAADEQNANTVGTPRAQLAETSVAFKTDDAFLQRLFDTADSRAQANIVQFTPAMKTLVEGGGYANVWIETQPMGGEMYAKRNLTIALNNQVIFMLGQRDDGRLPGMIIAGATAIASGWDKQPPEGMVWKLKHSILADYEMLQGFCFPTPAWKMYFLIGKNKDYLQRVYRTLEAHDAWLWRTRDSNHNGVLEAWSNWDTGEDESSRYLNAPQRWPFEYPPTTENLPDPADPTKFARYWLELHRKNLPPPKREEVMVPYESMDLMGHSFDARNTLARISRELQNGKEEYWRTQAGKVRQRLIEHLWRSDRHACYDRDKHDRFMDVLIHNNLRVMYHGAFTQQMADEFIRHHMLNPAEFWTPMPLPSIAVNDPLFRNHPTNDWSGQPEGLTYQRAIRALENYGHYAELTLLGQKLIAAVGKHLRFSQQFDPFTGDPCPPMQDGYGPTILTVLECISRSYGIHIDEECVYWSGLQRGEHVCDYAQRWGERLYAIHNSGGLFTASLNGREIFSCATGVRVVSDLDGNPLEVVGIDTEPRTVALTVAMGKHTLLVAPNQVWRFIGGKWVLESSVPFDYPYHPTKQLLLFE